MKELELSQGFKTYVDDEDYDHLNQWNWYYHKGRAIRSNWDSDNYRMRKVYLSRYIMKCPSHLFVDHIDGNPLNNTKRNLRICTKAQNNQNRKKRPGKTSSKFKGVCLSGNKWVATIHKGSECIRLGTFSIESDAAIAYNEKAKELFGEFAKLNDIPGENVGLVGLASASG